MRAFAEEAVANARKYSQQPLDYSEGSLGLLDEIVEQIRRHAGPDPAARKRLFDLGALKLGAYLGEVLRIHRGGKWISDEPGLPPGVPVLSVGRDNAFPIPAVREFLEGHAVDMKDRPVKSPSEYFSVVAARQRAWLEEALYGTAGSREAVARAVSDDPGLAEGILGYAASALLTAATRWGLFLDFSEKSLEGVEQLLGHLHDASKASAEKPSEEMLRQAAIVWGSYVGEVLRRHLGGRWLNTPIPPQGPVIRLQIGEMECYPLRKVEKRLTEGPAEAIPFYFAATRQIAQGKLGR
jgi:hypothetical protein